MKLQLFSCRTCQDTALPNSEIKKHACAMGKMSSQPSVAVSGVRRIHALRVPAGDQTLTHSAVANASWKSVEDAGTHSRRHAVHFERNHRLRAETRQNDTRSAPPMPQGAEPPCRQSVLDARISGGDRAPNAKPQPRDEGLRILSSPAATDPATPHSASASQGTRPARARILPSSIECLQGVAPSCMRLQQKHPPLSCVEAATIWQPLCHNPNLREDHPGPEAWTRA